MKHFTSGVAVGALIFAFCAFILSVFSLMTGNVIPPLDQERTEILKNAPLAEQNSVVEERKKQRVEYSCWEETIYGCGGDSWLYHNEYDNQDYLVTFGDADEDGEIRKLRVRYPDGQVKEVGQLESNLSYVRYWSEFDGSPVNPSPVILSEEGNSAFRIEVYDADAAIGLFDYRMPVLVKYVTF